MNMRKVLPIAVIAVVLIAAVLATWDRRSQREEAASIQPTGSVETQGDPVVAIRSDQVAAAGSRQTRSNARSRGVYRGNGAPGTVAQDTTAVDPLRHDWVKIPGTGVGLWPKP